MSLHGSKHSENGDGVRKFEKRKTVRGGVGSCNKSVPSPVLPSYIVVLVPLSVRTTLQYLNT